MAHEHGLRRVLTLTVVSGLASATARAAPPAEPLDAALEVLYHADLDGLFASPPCGHAPAAPAPDYAGLVGAIVTERAGGREPLVFLGGNTFGPAPFARDLLEEANGPRAMAELLSHARYDAVALGQQDLALDGGVLDDLLRELRARGVAVLASNLRCEGARATCALVRVDVTVRRGAETIGVLATISPDVLAGLAVAARRGLVLDDPVTSIRQGVRRLRQRGATRVIVLTQGPRDARALDVSDALARQLGTDRSAGAPDLILAGGLFDAESGRALRLLQRGGTAPVVGAFLGAARVRRVQLPARAPDEEDQTMTDVLRAGAPPDADVAAFLRARTERYCARYGASLLTRPLAAPLSREAFTKLVLEVMRRRTGAELAILNRGAVRRAPFPLRDELSAADLEAALPYPAVIGVARVPGAVVDSALGAALTNAKAALAGLARGAGGLEVNGRPLDKTRAYRVATISFVAEGGDGIVPTDALPWASLPDAPDLKAATRAFLQTEATPAAGSVDLERALEPLAKDRLLLVGLADVGFDFTNTSIRNPSDYGDAQLTRAQQTSLTGQATATLQLRLPRHQDDTRLDFKYGWARTQAPGPGMPPVAAETADLVTFTNVYSYRGLRDLGARPRAYMPDPYGRSWVESELTRPAETPTQTRRYHHLQGQGTAGGIFTLTPRLKLRAGAGVRRELVAPAPDDRWKPVLEAGATLDPTALATFGTLAVKLEGLVDYVFIDPTSQRDHELRATGKLSVPLLPLLFVTAGFDVYATRREGLGLALAANTTVGLRVHLDAAHQRQ